MKNIAWQRIGVRLDIDLKENESSKENQRRRNPLCTIHEIIVIIYTLVAPLRDGFVGICLDVRYSKILLMLICLSDFLFFFKKKL